MKQILSAGPIAALILISGCDADHNSSTAYVPTDVIGYADTVPILTLGEESGIADVTFSNVAGVGVPPDGSIVIANQHSPSQLYRFTKAGDLLAVIGRDGEGPGEFRSLSWVEVLGDTIVAYDRSLGRISLFALTGELIQTIPLPEVRFGQGASWRPVGVLSDGTVLALPMFAFSGSAESRGRSKWPLARVDLISGRPAQIAVLPGMEFAPRPGNSRAMGLIFGKTTAVDLHRDRIFVTTGDELGTQEYDFNGEVVRACSTESKSRRIREPDVDALFEILISALTPKDRDMARREVRELRRNAAVAAEFPAAGNQDDWGIPTKSVVIDELGRIWVAQYVAPLDTVAYWAVFAPDCQYLGRVAVSARFRISHIASDVAVGVYQNAELVESVRAYRINWHTPMAAW